MIVEDGTGLPEANSYVDVAFCDAYHTDRGNTAWLVLDSSLKEQAIVRASQAVDGRYRWRFPGERAFQVQALEWPRYGAFDAQGRLIYDEGYAHPLSSREPSVCGVLSGVPPALKRAVAEAALLEGVTPGILAASLERGGRVVSESLRGMSTTYSSAAPPDTVHLSVLNQLSAILDAGGGVTF